MNTNNEKDNFNISKKANMNKVQYFFYLLIRFKFKVILIRGIYYIMKMVYSNKKVWLFFDRKDAAKDNAEALYEYCITEKKEELKNIKLYFVIDKHYKEEYSRLKNEKKFNVIKFNSLKHKIIFLLSDKILSSQTTYYITNIFYWDKSYYQDLYNFKFIFLQHGVTQSNISGWLNSRSKKIDLIVTVSDKERNSMINIKEYGFSPDIIKTLGFARFDKLYNNKKNAENIILFMPTWRSKLVKNKPNDLYTKIYDNSFKHTDYYKSMDKIIKNEKLLRILKKYNYKIKIQLHPNMMQQSRDFIPNEQILVNDKLEDFSDLITNCKLLITDYSSISFDFAYLEKPVIYYQWDIEEFYNSHTSKEGYFNYKDNGFGSVLYNNDSVIEEIINNIQNDCIMEEKYKVRVEQFFKYIDNNNCDRIYNEIIKL